MVSPPPMRGCIKHNDIVQKCKSVAGTQGPTFKLPPTDTAEWRWRGDGGVPSASTRTHRAPSSSTEHRVEELLWFGFARFSSHKSPSG